MPDAPGSQPHASQTCAFCRIIRGEEQASTVFEDSLSLAFLDRRPPTRCATRLSNLAMEAGELPN